MSKTQYVSILYSLLENDESYGGKNQESREHMEQDEGHQEAWRQKLLSLASEGSK